MNTINPFANLKPAPEPKTLAAYIGSMIQVTELPDPQKAKREYIASGVYGNSTAFEEATFTITANERAWLEGHNSRALILTEGETYKLVALVG